MYLYFNQHHTYNMYLSGQKIEIWWEFHQTWFFLWSEATDVGLFSLHVIMRLKLKKVLLLWYTPFFQSVHYNLRNLASFALCSGNTK